MNNFSYDKLGKSFNKMTLRERYIIFAAVFICSFSISYFWIIEPAIVEQTKIEKSLQKSFKEENLLKDEIETVKMRLQQDPLKEINNKIVFSEVKLAQLNTQLDEKLVKFIHAQKMPIALTKVLSKSPGVKISAIKSLPAKAFYTSTQIEADKNQSSFYKHTLEITLLGEYNAIYQYLLNVESLQEKFYWYSLDYKVSEYPLAEVVIQIYTLSDQQDLVSG